LWSATAGAARLGKQVGYEEGLRDAAQQQEPSDAKDAARYRWLRDAHPATERVIAVQWNDLTQNMRHETLDAAIDAAMEAKK
jgi:hypothetical protein